MRDLCDHSSNGRRIFCFTNSVQFSETKPFHDQLLLFVEADRASVVLNSQCASRFIIPCHINLSQTPGPPAEVAPRAYPKISSNDFSRSRATSCGSFRLRRPS